MDEFTYGRVQELITRFRQLAEQAGELPVKAAYLLAASELEQLALDAPYHPTRFDE